MTYALRLLTAILVTLPFSHASESVFSVNDDVLAYPQYDVVFSDSYITYDDAQSKLKGADSHRDPISSWEGDVPGQLARLQSPDGNNAEARADDGTADYEEYQTMSKNGRAYFCAIPRVEQSPYNRSTSAESAANETEDLRQAASRGWDLLRDMEGKPCLYFSTGWWAYSFCYNTSVTQFHALPPGANGVPLWPPVEDPSTPSYVLGRYTPNKGGKNPQTATTDLAEIQTKAETKYLVQRLGGGTACDLTGKQRKIEVEFHCHPQTTDRIGWIKETATCAYLMVVYTPRLCNDVAFLPPKDTRVNTISCREVLAPDEVADWHSRKKADASTKLIGRGDSQRIMVGDIEVGAMKEVGKEGRRIERGRVVLTIEERAETVVMQKDGRLQSMSKADLRKLDLDPDDVDKFRKELQKIAGSKDWKIDRLDDVNGNIQLRGVVASEGEKKEDMKEEQADPVSPEEDEPGSEEEYKEEI